MLVATAEDRLSYSAIRASQCSRRAVALKRGDLGRGLINALMHSGPAPAVKREAEEDWGISYLGMAATCRVS